MIKYDSSSEVFCHDYRNLVWVINELMKNYWWLVITVPVLFIDNNKRKLLQFLPACQNNKTRCQTCLKLTIKALELSQYYYSVVFFLNLNMSYHVLVLLLLTLSLQCDLRSYRSFVSLSERTCAHFDLDAELNLFCQW